jgi:plasmid stabilization system protein ParE
MLVWFHPRARIELLEARAWYGARSSVAALAFSREIDGTLRRVAESPNRFPVRLAPFHEAVLRRFPFTVVFRVRQERVEIIAVAHQSRRPGYWRHR